MRHTFAFKYSYSGVVFHKFIIPCTSNLKMPMDY
jgi:hypothetical protein